MPVPENSRLELVDRLSGGCREASAALGTLVCRSQTNMAHTYCPALIYEVEHLGSEDTIQRAAKKEKTFSSEVRRCWTVHVYLQAPE